MNPKTAIIAVVVFVSVAVGVIFLMAPAAESPDVHTTDAADIAAVARIVNGGVATSENYIGQRVRLATGTVKNVSEDRVVKRIDLKIVFLGTDGQPIHESIETAFDSSQRPIQPGSEARYSIAFENLPRNWNYSTPDVTIVRVTYAQRPDSST